MHMQYFYFSYFYSVVSLQYKQYIKFQKVQETDSRKNVIVYYLLYNDNYINIGLDVI